MTGYEYARAISKGHREIDFIEQDFFNGKITREERDKKIKDIEYDLAEIAREFQIEEEFENNEF